MFACHMAFNHTTIGILALSLGISWAGAQLWIDGTPDDIVATTYHRKDVVLRGGNGDVGVTARVPLGHPWRRSSTVNGVSAIADG